MSRTQIVVVAWVLAAPALAACSSQEDTYCAAVAEHQEQLTEVAASEDRGALFDALPAYEDLREKAPPDLVEDWNEVVGPLRALHEALEAAGVDASDYDSDQPPAGVTVQQRRTIEAAASDLGDQETYEAMAGIQQQALDVCRTPLSR